MDGEKDLEGTKRALKDVRAGGGGNGVRSKAVAVPPIAITLSEKSVTLRGSPQVLTFDINIPIFNQYTRFRIRPKK